MHVRSAMLLRLPQALSLAEDFDALNVIAQWLKDQSLRSAHTSMDLRGEPQVPSSFEQGADGPVLHRLPCAVPFPEPVHFRFILRVTVQVGAKTSDAVQEPDQHKIHRCVIVKQC